MWTDNKYQQINLNYLKNQGEILELKSTVNSIKDSLKGYLKADFRWQKT